MIDIKDMEIKKWKCVFNECKALCCQNPPLITMGSVKRICNSANLDASEFIHITEDKQGLFRVKTRSKDGKCYFLNDDYSCKLHKINKQPLVCRMLPFKFESIEYGDEILLRLVPLKECPGYGKGEIFDENVKFEIEKWATRFTREIENYVRLKNKEKLSFYEILNKNWSEIE